MPQPDKILSIIYEALESLNLERKEKIPLDSGTALFGDNSALDSLSLVSVIVDVEMKLEQEFGRQIMLTDDRAMNRKISPYATVQSLADYIGELLAEGK